MDGITANMADPNDPANPKASKLGVAGAVKQPLNVGLRPAQVQPIASAPTSATSAPIRPANYAPPDPHANGPRPDQVQPVSPMTPNGGDEPLVPRVGLPASPVSSSSVGVQAPVQQDVQRPGFDSLNKYAARVNQAQQTLAKIPLTESNRSAIIEHQHLLDEHSKSVGNYQSFFKNVDPFMDQRLNQATNLMHSRMDGYSSHIDSLAANPNQAIRGDYFKGDGRANSQNELYNRTSYSGEPLKELSQSSGAMDQYRMLDPHSTATGDVNQNSLLRNVYDSSISNSVPRSRLIENSDHTNYADPRYTTNDMIKGITTLKGTQVSRGNISPSDPDAMTQSYLHQMDNASNERIAAARIKAEFGKHEKSVKDQEDLMNNDAARSGWAAARGIPDPGRPIDKSVPINPDTFSKVLASPDHTGMNAILNNKDLDLHQRITQASEIPGSDDPKSHNHQLLQQFINNQYTNPKQWAEDTYVPPNPKITNNPLMYGGLRVAGLANAAWDSIFGDTTAGTGLRWEENYKDRKAQQDLLARLRLSGPTQ
jgi:hypothetical protein